MLHLSIIPDGNRRWAMQHKLASFMGHKKGMEAIKGAIDLCIKRGIKYLSFYTFSLENFKRSEAEQSALFSLLQDGFKKAKHELIEAGVRVRFVGKRELFPAPLMKTIEEIEAQTAHLTTLNLVLLFCYGSQTELVDATKIIAARVANGELALEAINEDIFKASLWTHGIPEPDLIIRTGGSKRLSNLMLFQAAYSELMFLDCLWPEVTPQLLDDCVTNFYSIQRNFGV